MPNRHSLNAIIFVAITTAFTSVNAQNVYRCGNAYSQTPCPGGASIETQDERSKSQKTQADAAIRRDAKTADALEKSRLKQETPQAKSKTASEKSSTEKDTKSTGNQKKKPEYFTAKTAPDIKK